MIDIHPPQTSDHTWKDFFLHIGTIAVGILIAIGLEQTVELIHEHHQRTELRKAANTDARIYLRDIDENRDANTRQVEDLTARIQQVRETVSLDHPLPPLAYRPALPIETIRLGNFAAAKSSGLIHLLSEEEINSVGDAESRGDQVGSPQGTRPGGCHQTRRLRAALPDRAFRPVPSTSLTSRRYSLTSTSAFFSRSASAGQRLLLTSN